MNKFSLSSLFLASFLLVNQSYGLEINTPSNNVIETPIQTQINDKNIVQQMNSWGIPITTQKNNQIKLFSLINKLLPVFKNLPESISISNGYELTGDNAKYYSIVKNMFLNGNGETDLHFILKEYIFTIQHELGDKISSPVDERMLTSLGENPSMTEQYYSDFSELALKNNFYIDINYNIVISSGEKDSNYNRAKLYSIINNVPFILSVPNSYNNGVFNKLSNNEYLLVNNKFNIEYYDDNIFLNQRILFNSIYFSTLLDNVQKVQNKEIRNIYPMVLEDKAIGKSGVFIEKHKYYNKTIYINAKPEDIEGGIVKPTYFLQDSYFSVGEEDATVYVLSDYANISTSIAAKNITIYPLNSSIRADNITNDVNFNNTIIIGKYFVGKIDVENNIEAKPSVNIVLPNEFKDLFAYDYASDHLYLKNQRSLFKITKNTILSFIDQNTSFDKIVNERSNLSPEQLKTQYLIKNYE